MSQKTLGAFILEKRKERGMTQRDIEDATGLSHSQLSKLERDKVENPTNSTLDSLAYALNVDKDDLYVLAGKVNKDIAQDIVENLPIILTLKDYLAQHNPSTLYSDNGKVFDFAVAEVSAAYETSAPYKADTLQETLLTALTQWDKTLSDEQAETIVKDMEAVYQMWTRRFSSSQRN